MNEDKFNLQFTDQLYQELKGCANRIIASNSGNITLQTTEVVHEACMRLMNSPVQYQNKAHLYRTAAKTMRHLLIDHARAKSTFKRGNQVIKTQWVDDLLVETEVDVNIGLIVIDQTIDEMASFSERLESIVELHYFAGFTQTKIADFLNLGLATVERELKFARSFLTDRLQHQETS